jgi:hypothetical protein
MSSLLHPSNSTQSHHRHHKGPGPAFESASDRAEARKVPCSMPIFFSSRFGVRRRWLRIDNKFLRLRRVKSNYPETPSMGASMLWPDSLMKSLGSIPASERTSLSQRLQSRSSILQQVPLMTREKRWSLSYSSKLQGKLNMCALSSISRSYKKFAKVSLPECCGSSSHAIIMSILFLGWGHQVDPGIW